jgi:hypothetical protein
MGISGGPRQRIAVPTALALSLLLATQSMAATWAPPAQLTTSGAADGYGLVAVGTSTAVAVYGEQGQIFVRRTADGGASWAAPLRLSSAGWEPAIGGKGSKIDVVWAQSNGRVRYARSTNGGVSFGSSVALSPKGGLAWDPSVARGPNGRVVVAWHDTSNSRIRARVSVDGGATFGRAKTIANVSSVHDAGFPAVAVGKGVIYVAYFTTDSRLRIKRSRDSGKTWSSASSIANNAVSVYGASITAAGGQAYVAYTADDGSAVWARYRRTTDKGASWSTAANLSPRSGNASFMPVISLRGGVVRAAFGRCDSPCDSAAVFYRQSSNGTSWTAAETVATGTFLAFPGGVGYAGSIVVLYSTWDPVMEAADVYARAGAP